MRSAGARCRGRAEQIEYRRVEVARRKHAQRRNCRRTDGAIATGAQGARQRLERQSVQHIFGFGEKQCLVLTVDHQIGDSSELIVQAVQFGIRVARQPDHLFGIVSSRHDLVEEEQIVVRSRARHLSEQAMRPTFTLFRVMWLLYAASLVVFTVGTLKQPARSQN
jgi:hypothetical protein